MSSSTISLQIILVGPVCKDFEPMNSQAVP